MLYWGQLISMFVIDKNWVRLGLNKVEEKLDAGIKENQIRRVVKMKWVAKRKWITHTGWAKSLKS